jgi:hypothetical protein
VPATLLALADESSSDCLAEPRRGRSRRARSSRASGSGGSASWWISPRTIPKDKPASRHFYRGCSSSLVRRGTRDVADRAWHAGPNYRDIAMLFNQARKRLAFGGCMYVLFSTDSDLDLLGNLIRRADFAARLVAEQSIFIESLIIYELRVR